MPGDTTIILDHFDPSIIPESIREKLPDSITRFLDSLAYPQDYNLPAPGPHYIMPEWAMFLSIIIILAFLYFVYIPLKYHQGRLYKFFISRGTKQSLNQNGAGYDQWLRKYNPYYVSLTPELQRRFLERVDLFIRSKTFHYVSINPDFSIPALVAGAAVQLTFGLKNYLLDYFENIYVIGKQYKIPGEDDIYYGHVTSKAIHIAWNYFLEGYEDYTDGMNVGLHEMAHALSYDNILGFEDKEDRKFKERLGAFSEDGKLVFRAMRRGESHLLSDYATTDFNEFWAVCVETFFEHSMELKKQMPNLYREISELLNQDPLSPGTILDQSLA